MKTLDQFRAQFDPAYLRQDVAAVLRRDIPKGAKRYIITAAQNGTPVHEDFWACLLAAAKHLKAEILVIPLRYKNPTSAYTGSMMNAEWWSPAVTPYLWNQRHALNDNLTLLADIKTQPTAVDPLAGMDAVSLASSGILGHTKLRLRSVPTPQGKMAKTLTTTGAVTVENYSDTRTGKVGSFHHSLSALLVELDGPRFHLRQLHYSNRSRRVIDLDDAYHVGGYTRAPRSLAFIGGDTHVDFLSPMVDDCRHREGGLIDTVDPVNIVEHDLLDGYSCNPHHKGKVFNAVAKRYASRDSIRAEVGRSNDYLRRIVKRHPKAKIRVVRSNHDDFLNRAVEVALEQGFTKFGAINVDFLVETAAAQLKGLEFTSKGTERPDALAYWINREKIPRVHVLDGDESLLIGGVEHGMHGDRGPNGARGSVRNLARIGVKSWTGHGHSMEIFEGAYRVGTGTGLRLEYTHGPGSWTNTDGITNADGKRQLVTHIDGKFRL
jgi:hypothetical protein